jgi:hypothetical protein
MESITRLLLSLSHSLVASLADTSLVKIQTSTPQVSISVPIVIGHSYAWALPGSGRLGSSRPATSMDIGVPHQVNS